MESTRMRITPPHLRCLLPCAALCLMLGILLGAGLPTPWWLLPAAAGALLGALLLRAWGRTAAVLLLTVCVGAIGGWMSLHPALPEEGTAKVSGVVAEELREGANGQVKTILRDVTLNGKPMGAGLYWSFYPEAVPEGLTPGIRVTFTGSVYHPDGAGNPGGFDFRVWLLQQGVTAGVYGDDALNLGTSPSSLTGHLAALRHRLSGQLMRVMGEEAGAYASAMLLGTRTLVPGEDQDAFYALGIGHILSVSGFHVGVLCGVLMLLLRRLRLPRRYRLVPLALLLGFYALLTGWHPPVVRAALLVLLGEAMACAARPRLSLHLLSAAAIILLLLSPVQLFGPSFQLTFAALLGITLVGYGLKESVDCWRLYLPKHLAQGISLAVSAELGVLLPQLYWFQELPVVGIAVNVLLLPLFTVLLGGCWLVLALCFVPWVGPVLGGMVGRALELLAAAVRWCGSAPWLTLWTCQAGLLTALGWVLLLSGLCALRFCRRRRAGLCALLGAAMLTLSVLPVPGLETSYLQLSVGDEDAAVLRDGGQTWVIDTGEDGRALATYLHQRRLSVDGLIITHLHSDHAGGIRALMDSGIPVDTLYLPVGAEESDIDPGTLLLVDELAERGTAVVHLTRGDVLPLPNGAMTVLWPEAGRTRAGRDANLYSLALRAEVRGTSLLLTGDLSGTYELYAACPADVLKAAHHGSASSTSEAFLAGVAPQVTIISSQREVTLTGAGRVYNTGECGAVLLSIGEEGFTVETVLPMPLPMP